MILYKKTDWVNIDDSIRRLVYDLTTKDPTERISLSKLMTHVWLRAHFKDFEESKTNFLQINKAKKIKSEIEGLQGRLDSEIESRGAGTLKVVSNASSYRNFALNSVNSLFINTNGTSENSCCLLSPALKSVNSLMESPKDRKLPFKKPILNFDEIEKSRCFYLKEVLSDTERGLQNCIFADENPVEELMKGLNDQKQDAVPSKSFRF